jgi:Lrp/AsnC family transcriptional regulator
VAKSELDHFDLKILDVLQRNPPMTSAELADRVGLTQSPCWRRLTRLKEEGYVLDPVTRLDAEKLGFTTVVFANVRLSAHGKENLSEFIDAMSRFPEVMECHMTMGTYDFLLRIITRSVEDYRELLMGGLSQLPTVQEIHSTMTMGPANVTTALPIAAHGSFTR